MVVLYEERTTLMRGRAAMGSFADIIIDINSMSLKDNISVITELIKSRIAENSTIPKIVEKIPKKAMLKKLLKNCTFLISYPTENTIGGSSNEKNKSFENMMFLSIT
jgi:hypothetical protein